MPFERDLTIANFPGNTFVELGLGRFIIETGAVAGIPAVFIERAPAPGPVGGEAGRALPADSLSKGAIILAVRNSAGAQVLIDALQKVAASVDRSGEAGETRSGSTEGESAVPAQQGDAQTLASEDTPNAS
jgi:hypothetical protein